MDGASATGSSEPGPEQDRLPLLDTLRGFALFGILLVNMQDFSGGFTPIGSPGPLDSIDRLVDWLLRFGAEGKFRAIFAFLFGVGFALQLLRARSQGDTFSTRYVRRLGVLLLLGIAHYVLLWKADILTSYALVGLVLLPCRDWPTRVVVRAAVVPAGIAVLLLSSIVLLAHPRSHQAGPAPGPSSETPVYAHGSYPALVKRRLQQVGEFAGHAITAAPITMTLFLLGLAVGKLGLIREPMVYHKLLCRVFVGGLAFGVPANTLVSVYASQLMALPPWFRLPVVASYVLGGAALGLAYLAGLTLLLTRPRWQHHLLFLAGAGRMALTNYLTQSVVCSTLFYGYGFGWYSHVRPSAGIVLCLAIFLIQAAFSRWWLIFYRYGPAEWFWRCLTYQRLLPMQRL